MIKVQGVTMARKMKTQKGRPLGLTILSILYLLAALGAILLAFAVSTVLSAMLSESMGLVTGFASVILIIAGIVSLIIAYGLWTGRKWGWWIAIIFAVLAVLGNLVSLVSGHIGAIVAIIIEAIIIYYLTRPHVKAYFGM
jgi:uncharacterized membrane protein (DUF2068 family)